jgi:glycosyltransferase involved in cell wall biosynthesis
MKALVLAPQPFFSPRGTPFSVYYRTLVTAELGVKIDLLTYGEGVDVDIPDMRIIRIPRFAFLGSVKVGPSYLKLFLDILMLFWTVGLLLRNRYDIVHAHEEAIFFSRFLKPFFRFKLVYDMHSSLPQQLTNFQFTKSKLVIGLFKRLEDTSLRAADAIITICPDLSHYVEELIPDNETHFLIENSIFDPIKIPTKSRDCAAVGDDKEKVLDLPGGRSLVVYAGTLEPYQGIDLLISAIQSVHKEKPEVFFLILGGTSDQVQHYSAMAHEYGLDSCIMFTGRVPQAHAKHYSRLASVLVSPRIAGSNTPLKIYEQLASGVPLVATRIYSHTQVLTDDIAILVEPEPSDMARGILAALNGEGDSIAVNAKQFYEQNYSRPVYVGKMKRLLALLSS